nr:general transcription factor 3C polypeptide 6 [Onthophagus taurus]
MPDQETYIYLDLNGKLDVNYFQNNKIFFKMINLDEKPMVQIGNYVFEGKYEDYLGTKVFFVENQDYEASENIFERQSPLHLKYFTKTAKVLQLKWKSIPITTVEKTKTNEEYMELRFKESYNTVLEKFERAELNIKDIAVKAKDVEEKNDEKKETVEEAEVERIPRELEKMEIDDEEIKKDDLSRFKVLKEFIRLPKKVVENQKVFEVKPENLIKVKDAENYPVLKQLFLWSNSFTGRRRLK